MYVAPNTNVKFIRNCPLTQNLDHTILFESREAQTAYFTGIAEYTRDKYSFQRKQPGVIRVDIPYESCIYFNYMCYQNFAHANKWFYAFVTGCEYVNEGLTDVYFTLDVLQTWMFDWELGNCLIIRETTPTDEPGEYLLDEPIALGQYKPTAVTQWRSGLEWLVGATIDVTKDTFDDLTTPINYIAGQLREYQIYGCRTGIAWGVRLNQINTAGKTAGIKWVFPYPVDLISHGTDTYFIASETTVDKTIDSRPTTLGGYEPRNKKLLTYPYCFLCATTTDGTVAQYRYEYFANPDSIRFMIYGAFSPQGDIAAAPRNYLNDTKPVNFDVGVVLKGLPIGGFNYAVYDTWFALNKNTIRTNEGWALANAVIGVGGQSANALVGLQSQYVKAFNNSTATTIGGAVAAGRSAIAPAAAGAAVAIGAAAVKTGLSVAEVYSSYHAQKADMQVMPSEVALHSGTGDLQLANFDYGIDFNTMCILPEYAKVADDFFDRCGYKVMTSKVPTLHNRTVWDFIQTGDTEISGQIPLADLEEIKAKFERGVTFWHSADTFGDYTQTNATTG